MKATLQLFPTLLSRSWSLMKRLGSNAMDRGRRPISRSLETSLRFLTSERLIALMILILAGIYVGLTTQAVLTRKAASVAYTDLVGIAGTSEAIDERFGRFMVRFENTGTCVKFSSNSQDPTRKLLWRFWVYDLGDDEQTEIKADHVAVIGELYRVGEPDSFDVRFRLATKTPAGYEWRELNTGDSQTRLFSIGRDRFSPPSVLQQLFPRSESAVATLMPGDYVSSKRPTNSSAIEISLLEFAEDLCENDESFKDLGTAEQDELLEAFEEGSDRLSGLDGQIRGQISLFAVEAVGGACQSLTFAAAGSALVFLLAQACLAWLWDGTKIGGAFADEATSTMRLSGLVGTLVFLGAALSCVSVSPDAVKNAISTSQMTSLAGQAFWTTLVSSVGVRSIEATQYLLTRLSGAELEQSD